MGQSHGDGKGTQYVFCNVFATEYASDLHDNLPK